MQMYPICDNETAWFANSSQTRAAESPSVYFSLNKTYSPIDGIDDVGDYLMGISVQTRMANCKIQNAIPKHK